LHGIAKTASGVRHIFAPVYLLFEHTGFERNTGCRADGNTKRNSDGDISGSGADAGSQRGAYSGTERNPQTRRPAPVLIVPTHIRPLLCR
jgi:hypothetical protein